MAKIYVDVKFGDDIHGDGSSAKPFKSLTYSTSLLNHGDELIVNDSFSDNYADYVFYEPNTIELIGLSNVTIRFLLGIDQEYSRAVWKPTTIGDRKASLYIENCSELRIEGVTFLSTSDLVDHAYAIRAVNSSNIVIAGCKIHKDWEVDNSQFGEMLSFLGCTAVISGNYMEYVNNSYSNSFSFIAVDGNGDYKLFSNTIKNITTNNGIFRGIWVKPETRSVIIDGILVHNVESDLIDQAIGLHIESDNSKVDCTINGGQFSLIHKGIKFSAIPSGTSPSDLVIAKHCTFFKCHRAIHLDDSTVGLYSLSIHGPGASMQHEYPPGHVQTLETCGIFEENYSLSKVLNTIFTDLTVAVISNGYSQCFMEHIVWNNCSEFKREVNNSSVVALQFIRRINPQYEDLYSAPWGNFLLSDDSPCVDSGKKYGDQFLGLAPDIGALERSRTIRVDDLPALIARAARYSTKVPLTNIDIEGMIVRGLDTYDPEVKAGREGSAIRDLAVKPLIGLLYPFTTELELIRENLSFANLENLTTEAADDLAANLFVTRKNGDVATGIVRIYFEEAVSTTIPAEIEFISSDALRFYSAQSVTITAEEMALNFDNGLFYVDVIAEAEKEGAEYNIEAGAITRATSPLPTGVTAVLNPNVFSGGDNSETNKELKERIETAITVRDLVTKKGITYVLPDKFTFIKDIRPIGFRDEEMLRDEILGYHIGGKVDIYIQTALPVIDSEIVELMPEEYIINLASFGNVPILRIESIEVLDPLTMDTIGITIPTSKYTLSVLDPKTRFSIHEELSLRVHKKYVGATLKINYSWIPEMKSLQDWVTASEQRVVCADMLMKHFEPAFTSFNVAYYCEEEIADLEVLLKTFVASITSGSALQASDIIEYCQSIGSVHVVNPFTMRTVIHKVDGVQEVLESEDELLIPRTAVYIPDEITVTYLGADPTEN